LVLGALALLPGSLPWASVGSALSATPTSPTRATPAPALGAEEERGELAPGQQVAWAGFECRFLGTGCPAGFLREPDFSFKGCTALLFGCVGSCTSCGGSTSGGFFCQQAEVGTCSFFLPASFVDCGVRTDHDDCFYSANPPAGELQTPDGCYCQGAQIVVPGTCRSAQCTP
jgi:hypothetical protein